MNHSFTSKKIIAIGRNPINEFTINHPTISQYHAEIHISEEGKIMVKDLNSSGGTYVNRYRVRYKMLSENDVLKVRHVKIDLAKIFDQYKDYSTEFQKLEAVYEEYVQEKANLRGLRQGKNKLTQTLHHIPYVANVLRISKVWRSSQKEYEQKLLSLEDNLKLNYVCPNPKCKSFLGNLPYQHLANKNKCAYCRITWIKNNE